MSTMPLLQNTPNNRQNPPKPENVSHALARLNSGQSTGLYFLGTVAVFLGMMIYFMLRDARGVDITSVLGVLAGLVFCIGVAYYVIKKNVKQPIREQQRYYQLGNVQPLTEIQRRALRLELVENYYNGFWVRTLEYYPCEVRVNDKRFKPRTFSVEGKETYRKCLNDDWGIVSKAQYVDMVNELFGGMHSKLFAVDMDYVLHIDDYVSRSMPADEKEHIKKQNSNFLNRLAGLISKTPEYVTSCFRQQGTRPKPLIWAFDLWRVIPMSRNAYMAGYITEDEAWKNILKAADLAYYLFDSFEAFYDNYRLGNAYWSNDLETASLRLQMWELYKEKCDWEERNLPWQSGNTPEISTAMQTGFAEYVRSKNKKYTEPIGFKPNGE